MSPGGAIRQLGVEEEFQLIDAKTRRLVPRAPELLARLPHDTYVDELQRCVIEVNSDVHPDLAQLRADLVRRRSQLVTAAAELGLGVAAAGAVPLAVPEELQVSETPRYRRMLADYQLLAREQLICGTQVHVDLPDRDEAVQVANRIAPHLPVFLALSASSPFWADGTDTGYASVRSLVWIRWPSTGPAAPVSSAAEYDRLIADLVSSGVITDPGMVYFDLRPSAHQPTLELRVCDSCPSVDTIALIAGLFRALVEHECAALRAGIPATRANPTLIRAAMWRAARSGLEGDLVDVEAAVPRPAVEMIDRLTSLLRPELEQMGDWDTVSELAAAAARIGSSAARQRRILRRRGKLSDVVDLLLAETAGRVHPVPEVADPHGTLLHGYAPLRVDDSEDGDTEGGYDEAVDARGRPRPEYVHVLDTLARFGADALRTAQADIDREQGLDGVVFRVSGETRARVFPMDVVPRIVTADQWERLVPGLEQRARALNAFLVDVYGDAAVIRDGVLPSEVLDRAPGFRRSGAAAHPHRVRAHICGIDLVRTGPGGFVVLEDNLRVPSGVGYAWAHRAMTRMFLGELLDGADVLDVEDTSDLLVRTLLAAAPPRARGGDVVAVVLSAGPEDSAWFEHTMLAERTGLPLAQTHDLSVRDDIVCIHRGATMSRVDVLYARVDEDMLLSSTGYDGQPLRPGLLAALRAGTVTVANALGNGVGDDKAVYSYVPTLIEYYLGERPLLEQVPTWVCAEREQRDHVLDRLSELVVKPIDGFGGSGITIGPEATAAELAGRRRELLRQPERFVAQEVVPLSTHPTFDGTGFHPHHVDLRVFVHVRGDGEAVTAQVAPIALTRVAPAGSLVVNSSQGGGGKDTWILRSPGPRPGPGPDRQGH
ncbi:carboxylate--amine ligase/circularly permuted type 2 ATP-grasp protein [Rhodococcus zopfii]|uniref:carboxylate--amine ligase/circularly permuted type 2 ATP-grasp protein n=1 Tax=Rhodococcus zopfii TaxID=43772 RepID=UPI001486A6F1|nr:carboxylate--amine ligase/circularly permuted type 2 ATP-grasp protein [Rhodococcus zopfii]